MFMADKIVRAYPSGHDELGALFSRFAKGIFDINSDSYTERGVPFLRILNLRRGVIDDSNIAFIPEEIHQEEIKTELRRGDVVLSKTAYPAASLVTLEKCNTSQDTIATTLSTYGKSTYHPETIVSYLNSAIGQKLLWRQFQGNIQLHLGLDDGRKVPIPRFAPDLQLAISGVFRKSELLRQAAVQQFQTAEKALHSILGLDNWQAPEPLTYVRRSGDAFAAGRLDAEYFAPRIRELMRLLGRDGLCIGDVAPARHERFKPAATGSFSYLEIGGVRADGTAEAESVLHCAAPSRASQIVAAGDVITSSVRPIRRLSALIAPEQDGFVCSSGFVVLQPSTIAPEVLLTYLRLQPVCELMDLHTSASLYPAISEQDLLRLPIPAFGQEIQDAVCLSVRSAQRSRELATQLLDAAKRAVEIAIEDGEAAALAFLTHEVNTH